MTGTYWTPTDLTQIFTAICGTAHDFGGFTPEAAAIAGRLCQALGLAVALPEPTQATFVTIIQPPALPEPVAGGALVTIKENQNEF